MNRITVLNFQRLYKMKRCKICKYIENSKLFWKEVAEYCKRYNEEF